MSLLALVLIMPVLGALVLPLVPRGQDMTYRMITLYVMLATFLTSLLLWVEFDASTPLYQFVFDVSLGTEGSMLSTTHFRFGIDGVSLFFILLTTF